MLAGLQPSIGTVGDAFDNALAETTIGLYKTECIREGSPFRTGPLMTLAGLEGHHLRMGPLVQHQQAHAPPRTPAPCRSRGRVPSATRRAPPGPDTQVTRSASNPGRFTKRSCAYQVLPRMPIRLAALSSLSPKEDGLRGSDLGR